MPGRQDTAHEDYHCHRWRQAGMPEWQDTAHEDHHEHVLSEMSAHVPHAQLGGHGSLLLGSANVANGAHGADGEDWIYTWYIY